MSSRRQSIDILHFDEYIYVSRQNVDFHILATLMSWYKYSQNVKIHLGFCHFDELIHHPKM